MSGIVGKWGGKESKSGIVDQTFSRAHGYNQGHSYKDISPHDKMTMNFWNAMIIASIDSVGSVASGGPSLTMSNSSGPGVLFAGQQVTPPSGFTALPYFDTQRYLNVQRDNSSTEYNWSTSPAGSGSYNMCVWKRSIGAIRIYGF